MKKRNLLYSCILLLILVSTNIACQKKIGDYLLIDSVQVTPTAIANVYYLEKAKDEKTLKKDAQNFGDKLLNTNKYEGILIIILHDKKFAETIANKASIKTLAMAGKLDKTILNNPHTSTRGGGILSLIKIKPKKIKTLADTNKFQESWNFSKYKTTAK